MANYFLGTPNVENLFSFWLKIFRSEALPDADMPADPLVWVGHSCPTPLTWTFP